MLRSVVTTGSYAIDKYSRSYPSPLVRTQSQDLGAAQPEWQHFSNPVITLMLDVKKSMDNNFESVRLRVSWNMDMGHDGVQREVTMEDLRSPVVLGDPNPLRAGATSQGRLSRRGRGEFVTSIRFPHQPLRLPHIAVFRSTSLPPRTPRNSSDAIRPVCPCKETAGPPAPPIPTNRPLVPPAAPMQPLPARSTLARYHTSAVQRPSMPSSLYEHRRQQHIEKRNPGQQPRVSPEGATLRAALEFRSFASAVLVGPRAGDSTTAPDPRPGLRPVFPTVTAPRHTFQPVHGTERKRRTFVVPALRRPQLLRSRLQPTPPTSTATQRDDEPEKAGTRGVSGVAPGGAGAV
ncbi:hypothetical protein EDB83DRAFT_20546 [Lactarius deliciosus]|nr:hypothetical protein EDB83DRAFT_20546 [Lactarius deliciosus]